MKVFVIGPSFTGKSTLIKRLTGGSGVGVLRVEDGRLRALAGVFKPTKTTPVRITLTDNDALGKAYRENKPTAVFQLLSDADAFVEVVGGPVGDFMGFADTTLKFLSVESDVLGRRLERLKKEVAVGRADERELMAVSKALEHVQSGTPLNAAGFSEDEMRFLKGLNLLSLKPRVVFFNLTDEFPEVPEDVLEEVAEEGLTHVAFNLMRDDPTLINGDLSSTLLKAAGHITFFTPGPKEVKAWIIKEGASVLEAAAKVHQDLAKRFVRAEVVPWNLLVEAGGWKEAREKNYVRLEGRNYTVKDGDCIYVKAS